MLRRKNTEEKLSSFISKAKKKSIFNLFFELTYNCNLRCIHCQVVKGTERRELTYKQICCIIDQIAECGCLYLNFTGGEPLTRPDLLNIVRYTRKKKIAFRLITNGTLITRSIADKIANLYPLEVCFSLLGAKPDTHDRITRVKNSYNQMIKTIRFMQTRHIPIRVTTVVMKQNSDEIGNIKRLVKKLGVRWYSKSTIFPKLDGTDSNLFCQASTLQLKKALSEFPKDVLYIRKAKKEILNKPVCRAGRTGTVITPYGDLNPCFWMRDIEQERNLIKKNFIQIWENDPTFKQMRSLKIRDLKKCKDCELLFYCEPCPALSLLEKKDITLPATECCRRAEIQKKIYEARYNFHKYS